MRNKLREMYLDWFNNFLTIGVFADYYGLTITEAHRVINTGRKLHNKGLE